MKLLVTGASGFIGSQLLETLLLRGHDRINILSTKAHDFKKDLSLPIDVYQWNPDKREIDYRALLGVDVIIHLAGEPIADGRWNIQKKKKILMSRLNGCDLLLEKIKEHNIPIKKFISASAVGIYGNRGDEILFEESDHGHGFLAEVCELWERVLLTHEIPGMKTMIIRTGIVIGADGGALKKMLTPLLWGISAKLGNGDQYMSWIHIEDLIDMYVWGVENTQCEGIYNGVAPFPEMNSELTRLLSRLLKAKINLSIPQSLIRLMFGEMADVLLDSQRVIPRKFLNNGFVFKYYTLEECLKDVLCKVIKGEKGLKVWQWVPRSREDVFPFFSEANNLGKITPEHLVFKIDKMTTEKIKKGSVIDYRLKIHGLPIRWRSVIEDYIPPMRFTDTQVKGPYKRWTHLHRFTEISGGTLIQDDIVYKVPFGVLGDFLMGKLIKDDLNKIFNYRKSKIKEIFTAERSL